MTITKNDEIPMRKFAQGFRWGRGYAPSGSELLQGDYIGGLALVGVEHLGVNLRVLDIAMREHLCDSIDGHSGRRQERGVGVAKAVECNPSCDAGLFYPCSQRIVDHRAFERLEHKALSVLSA